MQQAFGAMRPDKRDNTDGLFGEPEGEDGVGDVGVVYVWAVEGVIAIDGLFELFCPGDFGEEWDKRIGVIPAVPFDIGQFAWPVTDDVIPNKPTVCLS